MRPTTALTLFSTVFLNSEELRGAVLCALYLAGLWKIFEKSGVPGKWALVPCAREYLLAKCAGREPEGRVTSVTAFFLLILRVLTVPAIQNAILPRSTGQGVDSAFGIFVLVFEIVLGLVHIVYVVRVHIGLCEVYGRRKLWIALWTFADYIPALLWGFSDKYQPAWRVEDMRKELSRVAFQGNAAVIDEGLTVNLKERSVIEFFQKKILLRDMHLSIPKGHMVLLLGGSGAGKTTFLNAVNGYEKADAEVMLNGTNLYTQYKKMQYEVGFVPQQELMRGKDTVQATLSDASKLRLPMDVPAEDRKKRVEEVMEIFGLLPSRTHLVEKLSGGQKKRVSIAMEFIPNPSLFILDEPDSGLDGVMARELMLQLRKIADQGRIVIVITHTPDRVIDLFDDVIVLAKDDKRVGRLAFYGPIPEARAFFGREKMEEVVKCINGKAVGGEGRAEEFIAKYAEVRHG